MGKRIANWLLNRAQKYSGASELKVEVDEHWIDVEYVDPESDDVRSWSEKFANGAIFVSGYANAMRPNFGSISDDAESDWITSTRYKDRLTTSYWQDALDTIGSSDETQMLKYMLAANLSITVIATLAVIKLVMG